MAKVEVTGNEKVKIVFCTSNAKMITSLHISSTTFYQRKRVFSIFFCFFLFFFSNSSRKERQFSVHLDTARILLHDWQNWRLWLKLLR